MSFDAFMKLVKNQPVEAAPLQLVQLAHYAKSQQTLKKYLQNKTGTALTQTKLAAALFHLARQKMSGYLIAPNEFVISLLNGQIQNVITSKLLLGELLLKTGKISEAQIKPLSNLPLAAIYLKLCSTEVLLQTAMLQIQERLASLQTSSPIYFQSTKKVEKTFYKESIIASLRMLLSRINAASIKKDTTPFLQKQKLLSFTSPVGDIEGFLNSNERMLYQFFWTNIYPKELKNFLNSEADERAFYLFLQMNVLGEI